MDELAPREEVVPTREQGDGSPVPSTLDENHRIRSSQKKPFVVNIELDVVQIILTLVSFCTRLWLLGWPREVVFDELHFAKFANLYQKRIFFFDVHPPLGKLLLALGSCFSGYYGNFQVEKIGQEYPPDFPVYQLRLIPCVMGSLLVPMVYQIAIELHLSQWAAMLAGVFILFDNALVVQSRFMLMESMLLFFLCLSVYSFLKVRNLPHQQFSVSWCFWLCLCGVSFTCCASIKYVGALSVLLILILAFQEYGDLLEDLSLSNLEVFGKHLAIRIFCLLLLPITIYTYLFYIHLTTLTKAGPHDNIMTSAFQASLEGGLAALTKGQPYNIVHGSQVTLRMTYDLEPGKPCWLHSHNHLYPIRYPDGRGSSHQQQVTCYVFKDVNNWWIIKDPAKQDMAVDDPPVPVKHGDVVQIVHGLTGRALNSHDVAAPLTPNNQEVSCYINYNISMPSQNLWKVEIENKDPEDPIWHTIKSRVRLIHVTTNQALKSTGKQLPEWGFHQLEVTTDKVIAQQASLWNVEEHRHTTSTEKEQQAREITQSEMIPTKPTYMSFWAKFKEIHMKMLFSKTTEMEHKYASSPLDWPFLSKSLAYWMKFGKNNQIHLIGNPVVWYCSTLSLLGYICLFVIYMMRRQRDYFDLSDGEWKHFSFIGQLVVGGYFCHYLPFFLTDSTLFMHSYLPCIIYKVLCFAALVDHLTIIFHRYKMSKTLIQGVCGALVLCALWAFYKLSVFTYGSSDLSPFDIQSLTWKESWEFLMQH